MPLHQSNQHTRRDINDLVAIQALNFPRTNRTLYSLENAAADFDVAEPAEKPEALASALFILLQEAKECKIDLGAAYIAKYPVEAPTAVESKEK
jgi:hypothetical protein